MPTSRGYTHVDSERIPEGKTFTRVTSIKPGKDWSFALKSYAKKAFIKWAKETDLANIDDDEFLKVVDSALNSFSANSKISMGIGSNFHARAEHFLKTGEDGEDNHKIVDTLYWKWKDWWVEQGLTPLYIEKVLVHTGLEYAGTCDLIARDKDGKLCIIDWKSSPKKDDRLWPEVRLQLTAYRLAWMTEYDEPIGRLIAVKIPGGGKVNPLEVPEGEWSDHTRGILNCLGVRRWEQEYVK